MRRGDAYGLAAVDVLVDAHRRRRTACERLVERATAGALGGGILLGGVVALSLAVTGTGNPVNQNAASGAQRLMGFGLLGLGEAALLGAWASPEEVGAPRALVSLASERASKAPSTTTPAAPAVQVAAALLAAMALLPRIAVRLLAAAAFVVGAAIGALLGCAVGAAVEVARAAARGGGALRAGTHRPARKGVAGPAPACCTRNAPCSGVPGRN